MPVSTVRDKPTWRMRCIAKLVLLCTALVCQIHDRNSSGKTQHVCSTLTLALYLRVLSVRCWAIPACRQTPGAESFCYYDLVAVVRLRLELRFCHPHPQTYSAGLCRTVSPQGIPCAASSSFQSWLSCLVTPIAEGDRAELLAFGPP